MPSPGAEQPCLITFYTRCAIHKRRCRCGRRSPTKQHSPVRTELRSPEAIRSQLKNLFFEHHWADDRVTGIQVRDLYIDSLLCSRGAAMSIATDALLTLHHGRISGSTFAKARGQLIQAHAVAKLQSDLASLNTDRSAPYDAILGTIGILNICWQYRDPSTAASESTNPHTSGLLAALDARGPAALESAVGRLLALDSIPKATFEAIHARKPLVYGQERWRAALQQYLSGHVIAKLQWIILGLPSLLHDTDQLLGSSLPANECNAIAHDILEGLRIIQQELQAWLDAWYRDENVELVWSTNRKELSPGFRTKAGPVYFSVPIRATCRTASPRHIASHFFYWLQLLEVYHAIFDINTLLVSTDMCPSASLTNILDTCEEITKNCQAAMPAVYETLNGPNRVLYAMPFLVRWYRKIGDQQNEEWCLRLQNHLQDEKENNPIFPGGPCAEFAFSGRSMLISRAT